MNKRTTSGYVLSGLGILCVLLIIGYLAFLSRYYNRRVSLTEENYSFNNGVSCYMIPERRLAFFIGEENGEGYTSAISG